MKKIVLALAVLGIQISAKAQFTDRAFLNGGEIKNVEADAGGNLVYISTTSPTIVGKNTADNNVIWKRTMADTSLYDILQVHKTDIYTVSNIYSSIKSYVIVNKMDSSGTLLWSKKISAAPNINCFAFLVTQNNQLFLGSGACGINNFILSLDSNGNFLWAESYLTSLSSAGHVEAFIEHNGNVEVLSMCALTGGAVGYAGFFIYEIDPLSNVMWHQDMIVPAMDYYDKISISGFKRDNAFNFYFNANVVGTGGVKDFIISTDLAGNIMWNRYYTHYGNNGIIISQFDIDPYSNLYMVCNFVDTLTNKGRNVIAKIDANSGLVKNAVINDTTMLYGENYAGVNYLSGKKILGYGTGYDAVISSFDSTLNGSCNHFPTSMYSQYLPLQNNMPFTFIYQTPSFTVVNSGLVLQADVVSTVDLCSLNGIRSNAEDKNVAVYPNPVLNDVTIEMANATINKISFYSLDGKLVLEKIVHTNKETINIADIESGIYILKVETNEGLVTKKIIKN